MFVKVAGRDGAGQEVGWAGMMKIGILVRGINTGGGTGIETEYA